MRSIALLLLTSAFLFAVPVDSFHNPNFFFPFGTDEGDNIVPVGDDVSSPAVNLSTGFPFLFGNYSTVYVNDDGLISFGAAIRGQHTPCPLPISFPSTPFIAPFWADVDMTTNNGRIYYRQTADYATLGRATRDVHAKFPTFDFFSASWVFIATWHNVTFFGASARPFPVNTFQAVLIMDGVLSFVMFNYGNLAWTTGILGGGDLFNGLGGVPASVGYNKGDGVEYYEHPFSFTAGVLNIKSQTNCGVRGRWMYRVDGVNGTCILPQRIASTPMITDCPSFVGPTVINRTQIEFYCEVKTKETDPRARFSVSFLFDFEVDAGVPVQVLNVTDLRATLHERYLAGRLNKALSCSVTSYFEDTPSRQSRLVNSERYFTPQVRASLPELAVDESDPGPARLFLYSNLPITCQEFHEMINEPIRCWITFAVKSSADIATRQRLSGDSTSTKTMCTYRLNEKDWKPAEQYAYDGNRSLDIVAKVDLPATRPRLSKIEFTFSPERGDYKTINGEKYLNPWFNYTLSKPILVYRYDSPTPMAHCRVWNDPHVKTFDGRYYSIFLTGNFTYVRNLSYPAVEVQVRHWPCTRVLGVSCVCGVAMREGDVILVADMCYKPLKYEKYDNNLPKVANITVDDSGGRFKLQMPSGNKILGYVRSVHLNIEIYISSKTVTQGLCGSFDGNSNNDIFNRFTRVPATFTNIPGTVNYGVIDSSTAASWRVTDRKEDLFDGNMAPGSPNPDPDRVPVQGFCLCDGSQQCGRQAVSDTTADRSEPQRVVSQGTNKKNRRRKRQASAGREDASTGSSRTYFTDDNPRFDENSDYQITPRWPAPGGILEPEARQTCRAIILNTSYIGQSCFDKLGDDDSSTEIVQSCVTDVQITGDFSWAESQVATMQQACIDDVLMSNYTELNDTEALYNVTNNRVNEFTDHKCEPFNCNNNGVCDKGSCSCNPGYIDVDCALSVNDVPSVDDVLGDPPCCHMDCTGDECLPTQDRCAEVLLRTTDAISNADCRFDVNTGGTYTTVGQRITKRSTTCRLPMEALQVHDHRHLNFTDVRPGDSNFSNLPLGGAVQNYRVSVSNNGRDFGSSRTYTLYNSTCMSCSSSGPVQKPNTCIINGYCFVANDSNPYVDCLKCQPRQSTTSWTPDFPCPASSEVKLHANGTCYCDETAAAIDMESSTENYYQLVVILTVVSAVLLVVIVVIVYCWRYKQFCRRTATDKAQASETAGRQGGEYTTVKFNSASTGDHP